MEHRGRGSKVTGWVMRQRLWERVGQGNVAPWWNGVMRVATRECKTGQPHMRQVGLPHPASFRSGGNLAGGDSGGERLADPEAGSWRQLWSPRHRLTRGTPTGSDVFFVAPCIAELGYYGFWSGA